ncbi:hypothetical protein [Sporosarcina obsidiansis]|uniref:hypothetical protein n=1 Tax=Sporosarcina obsidiansis TaxID=2660748 RepID=UPI00129B36AE|nr:hypothetical protein [Sporosarcina obsidiansis]
MAEEATPTQLLDIAERLEDKVDTLTEELDSTSDMLTRKALRVRRSAHKKPVKQIRTDFIPRLEKY